MDLLMDGQFDTNALRDEVASLGITLNIVAAVEHVPEIKQRIRVIKEWTRSVLNMLLFAKVPACVIIELIYYCCFWLNGFPADGGISDTISPRAICQEVFNAEHINGGLIVNQNPCLRQTSFIANLHHQIVVVASHGIPVEELVVGIFRLIVKKVSIIGNASNKQCLSWLCFWFVLSGVFAILNAFIIAFACVVSFLLQQVNGT